MLKITPFKTDKDKIKLRPLMEDCTIPKFPQSILIVGASGSGKTTLLQNLMLKDDMYKGYHNLSFLFARTGHLDDALKSLKIKKSHVITKEDDMIKTVKIIFDSQTKNIENMAIHQAPKILLIFEDLTTNKKLIRNPVFQSLWTMGRHLNIQVISMIHKYKALDRESRLNAMNLIYFRGSGDETMQLVDDFTPPGHTKKEFLQMVDYATNPDKDSKHNFLYMCNKLPFKIRYRKNFEIILELQK